MKTEKLLLSLSKIGHFMTEDEDFAIKVLNSIGYDTGEMSDDEIGKMMKNLATHIYAFIDREETGKSINDLDRHALIDLKDFAEEMTSSRGLAMSVMNVIGLDPDEDDSHDEIYDLSHKLKDLIEKNKV